MFYIEVRQPIKNVSIETMRALAAVIRSVGDIEGVGSSCKLLTDPVFSGQNNIRIRRQPLETNFNGKQTQIDELYARHAASVIDSFNQVDLPNIKTIISNSTSRMVVLATTSEDHESLCPSIDLKRALSKALDEAGVGEDNMSPEAFAATSVSLFLGSFALEGAQPGEKIDNQIQETVHALAAIPVVTLVP